jgi:Family of unknown function (DUF6152)
LRQHERLYILDLRGKSSVASFAINRLQSNIGFGDDYRKSCFSPAEPCWARSIGKIAGLAVIPQNLEGKRMKSQLRALLVCGVFLAAGGGASAHHSFAMFDALHPKEISGTVKEFRFVSPHTILIVTVKGEDGVDKDWILEGGAPGLQVRDGMTSKSLKPGDEITVTINPLHSGAEGGSYQPMQVKFKDGRPLVPPKQ